MNIAVACLLYIFRVYILYMIVNFEADFILKSRIINNGTTLELVGVDKKGRQLFRFCLSADETGKLG